MVCGRRYGQRQEDGEHDKRRDQHQEKADPAAPEQ